jgi:tetratricopeptide (TPR) repeat protein
MVMKRAILFLALMMVSFAALATERGDSLWNAGVECYASDDFEGALHHFKELENLGYKSPELYYNMGNTYYKMSGYIAYSILYYERALKLDPSYKDALSNLEFVRQFTLDKIEVVPEFVLVTWFKTVRQGLSSNGWAYLALTFMVILAALLLLFRFGRNLALRKISFAFAIIVTIFMAVSVIFSFGLKGEMESKDGAVVVNPVSSVKSSPNNTGKSLFIIHEGTNVTVLEELGQWYKVELSDGRQGWVVKRDIEII